MAGELGVYQIAQDVKVLLGDFEDYLELKAGEFSPSTPAEAAAAQHLTTLSHQPEGADTSQPMAVLVTPAAPAEAPAAEAPAAPPGAVPAPSPVPSPPVAAEPPAGPPAPDQPAV
ncbi:hypothetical protein K6U06_06605 [Acidiferrimicrobium sp. IK]|uniref:hypothetical protein n=1 Tax=Acidiferrimicrobium sp. IK TaxID=2871700 RepID=UPI0021CB0332|nr:hypothetical protein [Acidiferrimicrobium sp. IK]MCU4184024.1 hypothetical protein [Acidiferrimicrobium sp. IK]